MQKEKKRTEWDSEQTRIRNNIISLKLKQNELDDKQILGKREYGRQCRKEHKKLSKLLKKFNKKNWENYCNKIEKTNSAARIAKIASETPSKIGTLKKEDGSYTKNPKETLEQLGQNYQEKMWKKQQSLNTKDEYLTEKKITKK